MRRVAFAFALWLSLFAASRYVHAAGEQERVWQVAEDDGGYGEPEDVPSDPIAPPPPQDPEPSEDAPVDSGPPVEE